MKIEEIKQRINEIEVNVKKFTIVNDINQLKGKIINNLKTFTLDKSKYVVITTNDDFVLCISYVKCGETLSLDYIPEFNIKQIAVEEIDYGYESYSFHVFDLYFEIGVLTQEDKQFLIDYYPIYKKQMIIEVKLLRLKFSLKEAVANEDFKKAESLKNQIEKLQS